MESIWYQHTRRPSAETTGFVFFPLPQTTRNRLRSPQTPHPMQSEEEQVTPLQPL